jgi:[acyl-carrier-protein] S-malonyltransferase
MAAIIGLDAAAVQAAIDDAAGDGIVVIANYNSPTQFAVSGEVAAVNRAIDAAKEHGAKRAMQLQVSGAFHSPLMERTAQALTDYMGKFERATLRASWVANVTGEVVTRDDQVLDLLSRQLSSPVQWVKSMQTLTSAYNGVIVEAGPGKVLTGLMKRINADATVQPLTSVDGFESALSLKS